MFDPAESFPYRAGQLCAEELPLATLAERFGTPLYVYSHTALVGALARLRAAFAPLEPLIAYAVKANSTGALIRALAREGAGADVVSGGELLRALAAGVPPGRIVFSGVGKREDELALAVEQGIFSVNVEVEDELDALSRLASARGRQVRVSFRVNPDVEAGAHEYIRVGKKVNKFGLPLEDVPALYRRAAALPGLRPHGIDCHIGSQMLELGPIEAALDRLVALVERLRADGQTVETVDVGGGLGVRYTDETPLPVAAYAAAVRERIAPLGVELVLEPGRALVANAGLLLTRVLYRKTTAAKRFLIADAAMNDLPRPALYGARHAVLPVREDTPQFEGDLVGPICETGDFLARERKLPDAAPGELLAILSAGAYCRSMASDYNSRPRAAEVLVHGPDAHVIRARETLADLTAGETTPCFLLSR